MVEIDTSQGSEYDLAQWDDGGEVLRFSQNKLVKKTRASHACWRCGLVRPVGVQMSVNSTMLTYDDEPRFFREYRCEPCPT